MEVLTSLFTLRWQPPAQPPLHPLPAHVIRTFNHDSSAKSLELLISQPTNPSGSSPALLFIHGGYGSASVWLDWMTYLRDAGYGGTLYAYSVRNHGASHAVGYARMVYGTGLGDVGADLGTAFDHVQELEAERGGKGMIVVGHSAGGGLVQWALARGMVKGVRGLCLVDAIPHFGAFPVYANWARHDPWFLLRNICHLQHPSSPLSTPSLVHGAFFSKSFPRSAVGEFMKWMPPYESLGWPMGMMGSFWGWCVGRPAWLDVKQILGGIEGVDGDKVCVVVGGADVLMDVGMARKQAAEFRVAMGEKGGGTRPKDIEGAQVESEGGVRLVVADGGGHHLQNDLQRDVGAAALLDFVLQC